MSKELQTMFHFNEGHSSSSQQSSASSPSTGAPDGSIMGLMNIIMPNTSSHTYRLSSVISVSASATKHHDASCKEVAKWIIAKAHLPTATEKIKTGTSLPSLHVMILFGYHHASTQTWLGMKVKSYYR